MLRKVLIQTQFGSPHPWCQDYLDHFGRLESSGWQMVVFTPNKLRTSSRNVEIQPMTLTEYDELVERHCGVKVGNFLKGGVPSKLISDNYPAHGQIFQYYLTDADYWWFSNWDCVYGRLSKFIPDTELGKFDIWADEGCVAINGILTLFRNDHRINNLFRQVPDWEASFTTHRPRAFDEIQMSALVAKLAASGEIAFGHPEHFGLHSHDRLPQHTPKPNLYFEDDGALIEKYDVYAHPPARVRHYGREIAYFHFQRTKAWPV